MNQHTRIRQTSNLLAYRPEMVSRAPVLPRGAVFEAATAIITATHGPRPKIGVIAHHSHNAGYRAVPTDRSVAQFIAALDSGNAASVWDRRVTALTRAIVAEKRVLS